MQDRKIINEEIHRINQIMVQEEGSVILEQGPEAKIVNELLDKAITPTGVIGLMAKMGFDVVGLQKKFLTRFDDLIIYAGDSKLWNGVIEAGEETKQFETYIHKGVEISKTEARNIINNVEAGKASELPIMTTTYVKYLPDGQIVYLDEIEYRHIIDTNDEFYSIPPILRLPHHELNKLFKDVTDGSIETVEQFVRSFQVFLKTGNLSKGLKQAIMSLMANSPGFTRHLKDLLLESTPFMKRLRYAHYMGNLDGLVKQIGDAVGLKESSRLINDLSILLSKEGQLMENYFTFLLKQVGPMTLWRNMRFGNVSGWKQWTKTIVSDIFLSGFYNYVMGAMFLKSAFRYVAKLVDSDKTLGGKAGDMLVRLAIGWSIFGGYKALRDENLTWNPLEWFTTFVEKVSKCLGDDKVSDALTGRLFNNVTSKKEDTDGSRELISCTEIEFTKKFIESYLVEDTEKVRLVAEALYATLNNNAHDGNWWSYRQVGVHDGSTDDEGIEDVEEPFTVYGFNVQQIPSVTKVIQDQIGLWRPSEMIVNDIILRADMDIVKLSQISAYYETNFKASLYEDMQNMNQWARLLGGANWESIKTDIDTLPYLNKKQSTINFDTWEEMAKENSQHKLTYPEKVSWSVGDFTKDIILAKCGPGCKNGNGKDCNCGSGGCKLGGTLVDTPMGIALSDVDIETQEEFEAFCKGKDGFKKLKTMFDKVASVGGASSSCVLRPGTDSPEPDSPEPDSPEVIDTEKDD